MSMTAWHASSWFAATMTPFPAARPLAFTTSAGKSALRVCAHTNAGTDKKYGKSILSYKQHTRNTRVAPSFMTFIKGLIIKIRLGCDSDRWRLSKRDSVADPHPGIILLVLIMCSQLWLLWGLRYERLPAVPIVNSRSHVRAGLMMQLLCARNRSLTFAFARTHYYTHYQSKVTPASSLFDVFILMTSNKWSTFVD